jgi:hypothetical protein
MPKGSLPVLLNQKAEESSEINAHYNAEINSGTSMDQ